MSSSKSARQMVRLRSRSGPIEIALLDSNLNAIATGYGELEKKVAPGLYLIRLNSGTSEADHFITVEPGKDYENEALSLPIRSAAPLVGNEERDPKLARALVNLSMSPGHSVDNGGRLLIFVSNAKRHAEKTIDLSRLSVLNHDGALVTDLAEHAQRDERSGWAGIVLDLPQGGYALRWHQKWHDRWAKAEVRGDSVDQSMWVAAGWTTALFLNTNSNKNYRPRMTGMSVHMRPAGAGFTDQNEKACARVNQVAQMSIDSLHYGQTLVPDDLLSLIHEPACKNPMLAILCAHSLVQSNAPRWGLFDQLIRHLDKTVPAHPDAVALRILGKQLRKESSRTRSDAISWPPMLLAAYRALIDRDWHEGLIAPGTVAERAAINLLPQGPWSVWSQIEVQVPQKSHKSRAEVPAAGTLDLIMREVKKELRPAARAKLADTPWPTTRATEHEMARIEQYLKRTGFADEKTSPNKFVRQIHQVGLPVPTILRALKTLKE